MEIFEVILHTNADDECLRNVVKYPMGGREERVKGYGVNPNITDSALMQFKKTAEFWGNTDKNPIFHSVLSFTKTTVPTAERAMELTEQIYEPILEDHLAIIGSHEKERGDSDYHTHAAISPTNYNNGSMMCADNSTLFPIAQRMADITGEKCRLVVKPEDKSKKEFHHVFFPHKKVLNMTSYRIWCLTYTGK